MRDIGDIRAPHLVQSLGHQVLDLGMQLRQFSLTGRLRGLGLAGERRCHALDRLQRHLRLEICRVSPAPDLAHQIPSFSSTRIA